MNDIDNLGQVSFMDRLLGEIHGIVQELQKDANYKSEDAIADLMKLVRTIREEMMLKQF